MTCRRQPYLPLILYIVYMTVCRLSAETNEEFSPNTQYENGLKHSNHDLSAIQDTLTGLDDDLSNFQKRTCKFGLNSRHCALANLDKLMSATSWLSSGHSPGKRSLNSQDQEAVENLNRVLENVSRRREHLQALHSMLEQAGGQLEQRKRTCMFNLGGRCATELASAIADQYYYLNGPSSPGKRRRRAISFKLFNKSSFRS